MSGRRNELARARRRTYIKKALSLTSVPTSEEEAAGASATPTRNLDNHFGWEILQKSQIGDSTFPYLFQYFEKPNLYGREFDKVTYVLYMDKGTVVDKKTSTKGTQPAVSGILVSEKPSTPKEYYEQTRVEQPVERVIQPDRSRVTLSPEDRITHITPAQSKKKKLISEFYYVKRDRSRSTSPGDKNQGVYWNAASEWHNPTSGMSQTFLSPINSKMSGLEKNALQEKDRAALTWEEINKEKEEAANISKAVNNANKYQLRAGAEHKEREYEELKSKYEITPEVAKKTNSKETEYVKCNSDKYEIAEELLKTSSGTNQYLYVSGKKRIR